MTVAAAVGLGGVVLGVVGHSRGGAVSGGLWLWLGLRRWRLGRGSNGDWDGIGLFRWHRV